MLSFLLKMQESLYYLHKKFTTFLGNFPKDSLIVVKKDNNVTSFLPSDKFIALCIGLSISLFSKLQKSLLGFQTIS